MKINYRPEIDITKELGEDESSYYQYLIGVLRWIVELGWVDICCNFIALIAQVLFEIIHSCSDILCGTKRPALLAVFHSYLT